MFLHLLCLIHLDWLGSVFPVGPIGGGIKQLPRNCSKNLKSCANIVCLLCKIDNLIKSSYCNYITAKGCCITISRTLLYYYKLRRMGVLAPQYSKLRPAFLYRPSNFSSCWLFLLYKGCDVGIRSTKQFI